jgi:hypothetical protein
VQQAKIKNKSLALLRAVNKTQLKFSLQQQTHRCNYVLPLPPMFFDGIQIQILLVAVPLPAPGLLSLEILFHFFYFYFTIIMPTHHILPPTPNSATNTSMSSITNSNVSSNFDETFVTITDTGSGSRGERENGSIHGSRSRIQGTNTRNVGLSLPPFLDNIIQDIGDIIDLDSPKKSITKKHARSDVWRYFQVFKEAKYKAWTYCMLCDKDVHYTEMMSTRMLIRHLWKHHRKEYDMVMELEMTKMQKVQENALKGKQGQTKVTSFVTYFPTFEKVLIDWMIQTYQPISSCENRAFKPCARV